MKYKVKITEINEKVVYVEASTPFSAQQKAADEYYLAQDDKYILTADDHKSTDFQIIMPEYDINDNDRIAAAVTVTKILDSCNAILFYRSEDKEFVLESSVNPDDYFPPFHIKLPTLYDVIEEAKDELIEPFIESFYRRVKGGEKIKKEDWDRKCVILLEHSDYFYEVLKSITAKWYIKHHNEIMRTQETCFNDNSLINHLVQKSMAYKIVLSQENYQMVEYDERIFLAYGYDYLNRDEFLDALVKANGLYTDDICSSICWYYEDVVNREMSQIEQDIDDLGMNDMYLSALELDYLEIPYPDRYEITTTSDAYNYDYAIWDNKKDCYAEDELGDKYLSDDRDFLAEKTKKLNLGGWY